MIGVVFKDRYKVRYEIGSQPAATCYEALDQQTNLRVSLKILNPSYVSDPDFITRYQREIAVLEALRVPQIARVYDYGQQDDQFFTVSEYIDGRTLTETLKKSGRMGQVEASQLMLQVLEGLEQAHRSAVIHRNLAPSNIVVNRSGKVKLLDFGLVKTAPWVADSEAGAPYYTAPEQLKSGRADTRADIYAAGAILYEMLAGRPPFSQNNAPTAVVQSHYNGNVTPLNLVREDADLQLTHIVSVALQKNPTRRYTSALEMANALRSYLGHETVPVIQTFRPTLLQPQRSSVSRNKISLYSGLAAAILVVLAALVVFLLMPKTDNNTVTIATTTANSLITTVAPTASPTNAAASSGTTVASNITPATTTVAVATTAPTSPTPAVALLPDALFEDGLSKIKEQKWAEARTDFELIQQRFPTYRPAEVRDNLGLAYCNLAVPEDATDNIDDTINQLDKCLNIQTANSEAKRLRDNASAYRDGKSFAGQKNWPPAIESLEKVYAANNRYRDTAAVLYDAYLQYGAQLDQAAEYDNALAVYQKAQAMPYGNDPAEIQQRIDGVIKRKD